LRDYCAWAKRRNRYSKEEKSSFNLLFRPWRAGLPGCQELLMGVPFVPTVLAGIAGLTLSALDMGQLQQLNQELGRLCSNPPHQAIRVCKIHAQLVSGA
tara:strand:- start:461 stop:757 length:297 start_codon:yes stop_codon:yes gene_type:complete